MNFTITNAYLSISGDNLNLQIRKEYTDGTVANLVWAGYRVDDLRDFCNKHNVEDMDCSSDIDFPLDATSNRATLEACAELRGFDLDAYIERDAKIKAKCAAMDEDADTDEITVGDTVRSFDFAETFDDGTEVGRDIEGDLASYVVGIVEAIEDSLNAGYTQYKIRKLAVIARGKAIDHPADYFFPPVNGTPSFGGKVCNGVEKI